MRLLTTLLLEVSITVRVFWSRSATKASLPSELKATAAAPWPTGMVCVTLPLAVSTTDTWLVGWSAVTKSRLPVGEMARPVK